MPVQIIIPDSHLGGLKTYYEQKYNDFATKIAPLVKEWEEMEPILKQLGIVKVNNAVSSVMGEATVTEPASKVNGYNPAWSWREKGEYVITHHGKMTSKSIADIIVNHYEPYLNKDAILNSIPATLSVAAKEGKFVRDKNENGEFIYDLVK